MTTSAGETFCAHRHDAHHPRQIGRSTPVGT